ncbi:hypothetical protein GGR57DRAFT_505900 [Xylariaceae sp. FL1272]|nr:hypothetical protein GGR57DRAFT_505900 [Xylariaceae sp. FL1272]
MSPSRSSKKWKAERLEPMLGEDDFVKDYDPYIEDWNSRLWTIRKFDGKSKEVSRFATSPGTFICFAINTEIIAKKVSAADLMLAEYAEKEPGDPLECVVFWDVVHGTSRDAIRHTLSLLAYDTFPNVWHEFHKGRPGWDTLIEDNTLYRVAKKMAKSTGRQISGVWIRFVPHLGGVNDLNRSNFHMQVNISR